VLNSIVCRAEHFRSDWLGRWRELLLERPAVLAGEYRPQLHRKHWEWCAIAQALWERGFLGPGVRAVGFAVGQEPLPSLFAGYGVHVLATDLQSEAETAERWRESGQHAASLEQLYVERLVGRDDFERRVRFRPADMAAETWDLQDGGFDFVWSSCSFEHLGSLEAGLDFVLRSADLLRPGGVAIHTTEYNVSSNDATLEEGHTVLYRQRDVEELDRRLRRRRRCLARLDLYPGDEAADLEFDVPPYDPAGGRQHVKLLIGEHVSTSLLLIVNG